MTPPTKRQALKALVEDYVAKVGGFPYGVSFVDRLTVVTNARAALALAEAMDIREVPKAHLDRLERLDTAINGFLWEYYNTNKVDVSVLEEAKHALDEWRRTHRPDGTLHEGEQV